MYKKLLLASVGALALTGTAAFAAEPLPPPPPPPPFTWTGPYLGLQIGGAWGPGAFDFFGFNPGDRDLFAVESSSAPSGVIGGAHVGYLYQFNSWGVVGIEGSVDGTSLRANADLVFPGFIGFVPKIVGNDILTAHATSDIQGSVRGKLGFAWDRVLVYGTGGVAFGGFSSNLYLNGISVADNPFLIGNRFFSNDRVGWTAGGGVQYAVTDNWWVFVEYRYTSFGGFNNPLSNFFSPGGALLNTAFVNNSVSRFNENQVQAGFSYRFNLLPPPAPVVSKY